MTISWAFRLFLTLLTMSGAAAILSFGTPTLWPEAIDDSSMMSARVSAVLVIGLATLISSGHLGAKAWGLATYILSFLSVALLGTYQLWLQRWSCNVDSHRYVIGLKPDLAGKCLEAILKTDGKTDKIWNSDELISRFIEFNMLLACSAASLACLIFAVVTWSVNARLLRGVRASAGNN
jgi:hypothetical protein